MNIPFEDPVFFSFKYEFEGEIVRELKTPGSILNPKTKREKTGILLWDTGATISCINSQVASELDLEIEGIETVGTADGIVTANRHKTYITLSAKDHKSKKEEHFQILTRALSLDLNGENILGLIGMDIIGLGSFLVHYNKNTKKHILQYAWPSLKKFNQLSFQTEANKQNEITLRKLKKQFPNL